MIKKLIFGSFVVFSFLLLSLEAKPIAINIIPIKKGSLQQEENFVGNVVFKESANIASQSSGIVNEVNFRAGQKVKKGDKLLSLNDELLQKDIITKQAKLDQALYVLEKKKKELERYKNLLDSQSIPLQQYENVEYDVKSQEADILSLQAQLDISILDLKHKVIYAPFDGVIAEKNVELGDGVAQNSTKLLRLVSHVKKFVIEFDSRYFGQVKVGDVFYYSIDGGNAKYKVIINKIYPTIDDSTRKAKAEAMAPDFLAAGIFGDGIIKLK